MEHPMMSHAVAKHIQTNRHKRLHPRAATAIVQAHAVGTGTVPQDHRQSNQTPHLLLSKRHKTMILNGSRSESALGCQRHDVNATHRDEVFHLVFSVPHRERWSARLVSLFSQSPRTPFCEPTVQRHAATRLPQPPIQGRSTHKLTAPIIFEDGILTKDEAIAFTKVGKKTFEDLYGFLGYQSGQNKLFTKKELLLRFYEIKDQAKEIKQ